MAEDHIEVYQRRDGTYGWRKQSANGQITADDAGQGFTRESDARDAAIREYPRLPIFLLVDDDE
jgi:uncharacterized protein YegP (UPF0339 family)